MLDAAQLSFSTYIAQDPSQGVVPPTVGVCPTSVNTVSIIQVLFSIFWFPCSGLAVGCLVADMASVSMPLLQNLKAVLREAHREVH